MVLNYIWIAFFLIAFVIATFRLVVLGDTEVFPEIINSTFSSSKTAFEISLGLTGVLSLWLGIMKIGEKGGVIALFSRLLSRSSPRKTSWPWPTSIILAPRLHRKGIP